MSQPPAGRPAVSISRAALIWAVVGVVVIALVAALIGGWIGAAASAPDAAPQPTPTAEPAPEPSDTPMLDDDELAELEERIAEILPAGSAIRVGTGVPPEDRGIEGDVYINLTNSDVYVRRADGWERVGNLRVDMAENLTGPAGAPGSPGDTGPQGEAGQDGTQVVLGAGAPEADATCAPDGSIYIDTETSTYYTCTTGAWVRFGPDDPADETETEG